MPLVRIDLLQGKPSGYRAQIGEVVYRAMLATINVPDNDRFQVITEHSKSDMPFDPGYMRIHRTDDCIFITDHAQRRTYTRDEAASI